VWRELVGSSSSSGDENGSTADRLMLITFNEWAREVRVSNWIQNSFYPENKAARSWDKQWTEKKPCKLKSPEIYVLLTYQMTHKT